MNPKIIYPIPTTQSYIYRTTRKWLAIIFLVAAITSVIANIVVKGKFWSIVVVWSLFAIYRSIFSLKLVEFSAFSHASRIILRILILLWLIDHFLAPGWADTVMPIVGFGSLVVMVIIFYVFYSKKEQHILSVVLLGIFAILTFPATIRDLPNINWIAVAFSLASFIILLSIVLIHRNEIKQEISNRFRLYRRDVDN